MKKIKTLLLGAILATTSLSAQSNPGASMWNDPEFVKGFVGSYQFLQGYEPKISDEEKDSLRSLLDLIKSNPVQAAQLLEPQITPSSSAAFDFILANLHFQNGNLSKARTFYTNATKKWPAFRRAYKNLALVLVQEGDFDAAIPVISKALELGEVDGRAYGLLAYGYLLQGKYYPAEAAYRQAILIQPDVNDWKIGLARCLLESENYADAIALFNTLLKDDPDNADFWLLQSNAYLGSEQTLKAAQNIEVVRRMGAAKLQTLTLLGDIYMNNGHPDLALSAYLAAVEKADKTQSESLVRAADILSRTGNFDQAQQLIEKIRVNAEDALNDEQDLMLLNSEAKIARAKGNNDAAVEILNKIVERDSLNGDAIIELANYYSEKGMMPEAITRFEQAAKIEASERKAVIAHAQALVRNGEYRDAVPLLKRALQIQDDRNLSEYTERVERAAKSQS
ncbi:MAG: tetratricopeptide repeat protein [Opitutales bacterium]|jgi:tetratricopeptide (TPR) repeat protein|nr:tetratricopeptide repeat protein [Opitutales bacterium]MDP4645231.1 tetratricopeptide repeat protein [Opitutales bacterium]MDP4778294.1 tetratricopeptide repeat protein [Opitutales bacterium]MDP4884530.1 tetratricopeptide repeat protein [Opitutales bacterium]MDP5080999.1 tetratricopeptide repeat protein [Opitutales bacterium]